DDYERRQPVAPNPPNGAILSYYFKEAPKDEVKLDILDSSGKVVRHFSSADSKEPATPPEWPDQQPPQEKIPAQAGLNRFSWDMRLEGPLKLPGEVGAEFRNKGPFAFPGTYQARFTANAKTQRVHVELKLEPGVNVSQADQQKQYELDLKIRDQISDLHDTVNDIRTVRVQFRGLENRLGDDAKYKMILTSAQTLDKKMTPIEEQLLQVKAKSTEANLNFPVLIDERLHSLLGSVDNPDAAPT